MNYKDVALLNGSLDSLSDNLLKQKVMQQQAAEKQQQLGVEQTRADSDADFRKAQLQHYKNIEDLNSNDADVRKLAAAQHIWAGTTEMLSQAVNNGTMDPDVASQHLAAGYAALPDDQRKALAGNAFAEAAKAGKPIWQAPPAKVTNDPTNIAIDKAATPLEAQGAQLNDQADQSEARIGTEAEQYDDTPENVAATRAQAAIPLSRAKFLRGQKEPPPVRIGEHYIPNPDPNDVTGKPIGKVYDFAPPGQSPAAAPAASAVLPVPANKAQMVKGQQYQVQGSAWTWDGEKFVK